MEQWFQNRKLRILHKFLIASIKMKSRRMTKPTMCFYMPRLIRSIKALHLLPRWCTAPAQEANARMVTAYVSKLVVAATQKSVLVQIARTPRIIHKLCRNEMIIKRNKLVYWGTRLRIKSEWFHSKLEKEMASWGGAGWYEWWIKCNWMILYMTVYLYNINFIIFARIYFRIYINLYLYN